MSRELKESDKSMRFEVTARKSRRIKADEAETNPATITPCELLEDYKMVGRKYGL
jgi:hypothetical protein